MKSTDSRVSAALGENLRGCRSAFPLHIKFRSIYIVLLVTAVDVQHFFGKVSAFVLNKQGWHNLKKSPFAASSAFKQKELRGF